MLVVSFPVLQSSKFAACIERMHAFFISGIPKQQKKSPFRAALSAPSTCEGTTKVIENSNVKRTPH